jgi:hypothetical protein
VHSPIAYLANMDHSALNAYQHSTSTRVAIAYLASIHASLAISTAVYLATILRTNTFFFRMEPACPVTILPTQPTAHHAFLNIRITSVLHVSLGLLLTERLVGLAVPPVLHVSTHHRPALLV